MRFRSLSGLFSVLLVIAGVITLIFSVSLLPSAASAQESLVVYSGRSKELVQPIFDKFSEKYGIELKVRYGKTSQLAATLLEEGTRSPADVFFSQNAGALGALESEGILETLPNNLLDRVEERFRSKKDKWIGVTGRARVVAYSSERLTKEDLPKSILEFTDPKWKGRIGWPPTNASFQAFVTAMRVALGDDATEAWLRGILANKPKSYPKNTPIIEAIAKGEIDVGFVNHYYLYRFKAERGQDFPVENYYLSGSDVGALINVAGVGILESSKNKETALKLIDFLTSEEAQKYFAEATYEYPLVKGVKANQALPPLEDIDTPDIDLSDLSDLENTLKLLRKVGIL